MIITLKIEDPVVISLNKYRVKHWTVHQKIRDDQLKQIKSAIRRRSKSSTDVLKTSAVKDRYNIPSFKKYPVSITFQLEKSRPFDCDNIILKYWIDALVKTKTIKGDSPQFVGSTKVISKTIKGDTKLTIEINDGNSTT